MKKIFTLITIALLAIGGANAQTTFLASATAPEKGTSLIDDELVTVKTVYETKAAATKDVTSVCGLDVSAYFQLRVAADPSTENLTGTTQKDCTPLVVTAKKNSSITIYYRRQKGSGTDNAWASNDNKDLLAINQADPTTKLDGILTYDPNVNLTTEDYAIAKKTYNLTAGNTYTLYRKGSTIRVFALVSGETTTGISTIKASTIKSDENAPIYNVAGQRVSKDYKGIVIQNGKKFLNNK